MEKTFYQEGQSHLLFSFGAKQMWRCLRNERWEQLWKNTMSPSPLNHGHASAANLDLDLRVGVPTPHTQAHTELQAPEWELPVLYSNKTSMSRNAASFFNQLGSA